MRVSRGEVDLPPILRMRDVTELVGVSRMTIYRWCRSGDFPPPHRLGARCIGWYREEIEQWRATRPVALTTG